MLVNLRVQRVRSHCRWEQCQKKLSSILRLLIYLFIYLFIYTTDILSSGLTRTFSKVILTSQKMINA